MEIGVVFPQTELGADVDGIRAFAAGIESLGYSHVMIYDHVVGADPAVHRGWSGPYDVRTTFHEPFVLLAYLAGFTSLEFLTGILVLPQRQTVLVAKQAAELDLLSRGRLRLGVGLGWNAVEYEALGMDYSERGRRIEEQIVLLRRLWSEASVTHRGAHDRVTGAGLAPRSVQRPIPLWYGGESPVAYRRAGRVADGWIPDNTAPGPKLDDAKRMVEAAAREAGRDPARLGMQGRIKWGEHAQRDVGAVREHAAAWRAAGASHVAINTMDAGLAGVGEHLDVLRSIAGALRLSPRERTPIRAE
jgi:probable F420-dependent oxidoreductase